ncbi:lipoprotein lipase [Pimephales promelas]|nr:lipoprotein lipase [Pimephales promelas]
MGKESLWLLVIGFSLIASEPLFNSTEEVFNATISGNSTERTVDYSDIESKFSIRNAEFPDEDLCYLVPGVRDSVSDCNFKNDSQTFLIIHGWSVAGLFESWVHKLVTALFDREPSANVVVVDWLDRANEHYPRSAENTGLVGADVAKFIDWLEEELDYPLEKVHLLGYSLGAHVAGVAGNLTNNKVNRITGLDPAGPSFENAESLRRLSQDDASFVDVLHTNTRGSPDLSIGIQRPVGHVDIYPNGGTFQPGCTIQHTMKLIATYGIYMFHYQIKLHLFSDKNMTLLEQPMKVSLFGTTDESDDISVIVPSLTSNSTISFLVTSDKDIGELLMLNIHWEMDSYLYGFFSTNQFTIRRMRIKSGETQSKVIFRPKDEEFGSLVQGGEPVVFVKSSETPQSRREERKHRLKHHGSFFKQGVNEATADMRKEAASLHNESTEVIVTETTTNLNTTL